MSQKSSNDCNSNVTVEEPFLVVHADGTLGSCSWDDVFRPPLSSEHGQLLDCELDSEGEISEDEDSYESSDSDTDTDTDEKIGDLVAFKIVKEKPHVPAAKAKVKPSKPVQGFDFQKALKGCCQPQPKPQMGTSRSFTSVAEGSHASEPSAAAPEGTETQIETDRIDNVFDCETVIVVTDSDVESHIISDADAA